MDIFWGLMEVYCRLFRFILQHSRHKTAFLQLFLLAAEDVTKNTAGFEKCLAVWMDKNNLICPGIACLGLGFSFFDT